MLYIILVTVLYLLYYYFTRTFNYWKDRNVVGPKPVPLFGNLKESALRRRHMSFVCGAIHQQFPNEKVVGIFRMTSPSLLIRDLNVIKELTIKTAHIFSDRGIDFDKSDLGDNLFHADGESARVLKAILSPVFTSSKLRNMFHLIVDRGDRLLEYLDDVITQPKQEVYSHMKLFTITAISACMFGLDIDMRDEIFKKFDEIDKQIFTLSWLMEVDMMYPGIMKKFSLSVFPGDVANFFRSFMVSIIAERQNKLSNRNDLIDILVQLQKELNGKNFKMSDDRSMIEMKITPNLIMAQAMIFYAAGYETSASTISSAIYLLAKYPEVQEKVIEEIDRNLLKNDGQITYDNLADYTYLEQVYKEVLRMYPVADPVIRRANQQYKIRDLDVSVEKGQIIVISIRGIHNDEKYYPRPEEFDPERFAPDDIEKIPPYAYIPFGIGPRICTGMRFARLQFFVGMVKVLSKYRVKCCKDTPKTIPVDPGRSVISPGTGIYLDFIRRIEM